MMNQILACVGVGIWVVCFAVTSVMAASTRVIHTSEVQFDNLNPARGDKSPKAGTLWGDRNGTKATGFLLKPADKFSSPPHIHNVSYRAVVISGVIHNDDTNAARMWMPAGSFWTQPRGEVHITCALGVDTLAYVEIEEGPYLVHPAEQAFDSGERPVNVDESNIVWLDQADISWVDCKCKAGKSASPEMAFLWGKPEAKELNGTFIKLPAGFSGAIRTSGETFGAVVVKGNPVHRALGNSDARELEPGSYFGSDGAAIHEVRSSKDNETILYIRTAGKYKVVYK